MVLLVGDTGYASSEVFLQSEDGLKISDTTIENDLLFYFKEQLAYVHSRYDLVIGVSSATIPFSCPNIAAHLQNNTLQITRHLFPFTVTVPDGQYNINDLVSVINEQLALNVSTSLFPNGPLTFSYNRNTGMARLVGASFSLTDFSGLAAMLGLATADGIGTKQVDLRRSGHFYIQIPEMITDNFMSDIDGGMRTGIIARIPIDVNPASKYRNVIHWVNQTGYETKISIKTLNRIHIRILDDKLRLVALTAPWSINLRIGVVSSKPTITYETRLVTENNKQVEESVAVD